MYDYDDMTLEEMENKREEMIDSMKNEEMWMLGSNGDDYAMHRQNLNSMMDEYMYLCELIAERKGDNENLG